MQTCEEMMASLSQLNVNTLLSNISSSVSPKIRKEGRKRRRGEIANPSNTLDALVARKADEHLSQNVPFEKRYLSEHEAIEGPDDEMEMKKMEADPDVSTRTCSTCGYQGKWVSEMIRHKRVHTSERPFKCKYCSRTSKWKADLIRHVAKTHGIRVVSKYSRSKVFDSTTTIATNDNDSKRCSYRCAICSSFEDERVSLVKEHVRNVHSSAPFGCRCCNSQFDEIQLVLAHANNGNCTNTDLVFNVVPNYEKPTPLSPCQSETSASSFDSGVHTDQEEEQPPLPALAPIHIPPIMPIQSNQLLSIYLASLLQSNLLQSPPVQPVFNQISPNIMTILNGAINAQNPANNQLGVEDDLVDVVM